MRGYFLRKGIEQGLIEEEAGRKVDLRHCLILLDTEQSRTVSGLGFQAVSVKMENEGWDEIADAILDFGRWTVRKWKRWRAGGSREITRQMPQLAFELGETRRLISKGKIRKRSIVKSALI